MQDPATPFESSKVTVSPLSLGMAVAMPILCALLLRRLTKSRIGWRSTLLMVVTAALLSHLLLVVLMRTVFRPNLEEPDPASVTWVHHLREGFLGAAIPEELVKLAATLVLLRLWRHTGLAETVCIAGTVGLGFAAQENLLASFTLKDYTGVLATRALTTVLHAASGVVMGYFIGLAFHQPARKWLWWTIALAGPVLTHGLYDFAVFGLQAHELPEMGDEPTPEQTTALLTGLGWMAASALATVIELAWAGWVIRQVRKTR
jgi:RsiW-degrading membrane proteinase PrsW (M82 family)